VSGGCSRQQQDLGSAASNSGRRGRPLHHVLYLAEIVRRRFCLMLLLVRPCGAAVCPTLALEGLGREAGLEVLLGSTGSVGIGKRGGSMGVRMPCIGPRTSSILPSCIACSNWRCKSSATCLSLRTEWPKPRIRRGRSLGHGGHDSDDNKLRPSDAKHAQARDADAGVVLDGRNQALRMASATCAALRSRPL
jgi:hypothetical protein